MPGVTFLIFSIEALSSFVRFKMSATEPWFKKRRNNVLNMLSSETLHLAVKKKKKKKLTETDVVFCHPHDFCLIGFHSRSLSLLLFEALLWKWTCPVSHLHQALDPFFTFLLSRALSLTLMQQKLHFSQYLPSHLPSVKSLFVFLSVLSRHFCLFLITTWKKILFFFSLPSSRAKNCHFYSPSQF